MENDKREELVQKAKARIGNLYGTIENKDNISIENLIERLSIYEAELEIQNEELRDSDIKLRKAIDKYMELYDNAPMGYIIFDKNGVIREINNTGVKYIGKKNQEILNKPFVFFVKYDFHAVFNKHLSETMESDEKCSCEIKVRNMNNPDAYMILESVVYFDEESNQKRIKTLMFDYTQQKILENEIMKAKIEAEKANKLKSQFLSNMSHEIRTPMNSILGFIHILSDMEENIEKKEFLEIIKTSSKNLMVIINDVLDLAKIEAGKHITEKEVTDIFSFIDKNIIQYRKQAESKGLQFLFEFDENMKKRIIIDNISLMQILNNLLSNAVKFTERGFIQLSICEVTKNNLQIEIKDTGIGIKKEKQERLFEPFEQGEHFLTKKYGGTGLGLSIVKKLVDILGGQITVKPIETGGTIFSVIIPFENDKEITQEDSNKMSIIKDEKGYSGINIIYAEDIKINQKLIELISKKNGWNITSVNDGEELLNLLENELVRNSCDIILMDMQMPKVNGLEATRRIREHSINIDIPIIGLSAFAFAENIAASLSVGMNDFIAKPIDTNELESKIIKWTRKNGNKIDSLKLNS